jgi:Membrane transport protein
MDFALPASLFASTGSAPRGEMMAQGPLFAILGAVMLIIYLLWYLFERKASRRSRGKAALQALTVAVPNYAGIGLPIASTVLGPTATGVDFSYMMVVDGAHSPGDIAERHDEENGRKHREDHLRHEKNSASQAWMKSVIARRSADPPGLSRRVTNDWCTTLARSRQLRVPTPPSSRKTRAAYWA